MLEHVFASGKDVACCTILDSLERLGIGCSPVRDSQGIPLDGFDGTPHGVCGVALGLRVCVFGVQGCLSGVLDVLTAVPSGAFEASQRIVAVREPGRLETCIRPAID